MKKRIITIIIALVTISVSVLSSCADVVMIKWSFDDGVLTVKGSSKMNYSEYPWEKHTDDITEIIIEDGVKNIGDKAFRDCESLKKVTIAESVEEIGNKAFAGCDKLEFVYIENSEKDVDVEKDAFPDGCKIVWLDDDTTFPVETNISGKPNNKPNKPIVEVMETAKQEEVTTAKPPIEENEPIPRENAVIVAKYDDFAAAELDSIVVVETYVQAKQSWWDGKGTFYTQNKDGAYFLYEMPCSETEYKKLVPGTKIEVAGYKAEWAGELEITEAEYKIIPSEPFIATALDVTELLGTDELIAHQNKFVTIKGMTVDAVEYKNGEPGDDVYVNLSKDGVVLSACIEVYLTGPDTEVYKTAGELKAGDVVDIEGFLYWYEGPNPHITSIKVTTPAPEGAMGAIIAAEINEKSEGAMTYAEYAAAALDAEVVVEGYIQAKQSWWDNRGTFYLQDGNGAYYLYEMPCTEEEYNTLTVGTKIKATGYKTEWAGEVEVIEAQFEIIADAQSYVATALDVTELLGTDELAAKQNMFVAFNDMTVESVEYKNGEPGDDIYLTFSKNGLTLGACIEVYLTGPDTEVYKKAGELKTGDVVDLEGFLYWYEGPNPHITSIAY